MRRICHQYGINMTELRTILGMPPRAKRQSSPLTREERQAIADLRSEGYSDAAIEAVFGDCPPPTQAEWDNKQEKKSWND